MERKYTTSELRQKLIDKREQIKKHVIDRLRAGGFFQVHELYSDSPIYLDGELVTSWEQVKRVLGEAADLLMSAATEEMLRVLLEDEQAR